MANIISVDTSDLEKLTKFLKQNSRNGGAFAIAVQQTLNGMAFEGRKRAIRFTIPRVMTVRNKTYVNKSIAVNKVPNNKPIKDMESELGARDKVFGKTALGWAEMETGRSVRSPYRGKSGMHATKFTRKQNFGASVPVKKRVKNLTMTSFKKLGVTAKSPQKQAAQALTIMKKEKIKQAITLEYRHGKKGVFQIIGGKVRMLYRIGKKKYTLKKRSWLKPSADYAAKRGDKIFVKAATRQVDRLTKKLGIKFK